jgi:hypothetical protein
LPIFQLADTDISQIRQILRHIFDAADTDIRAAFHRYNTLSLERAMRRDGATLTRFFVSSMHSLLKYWPRGNAFEALFSQASLGHITCISDILRQPFTPGRDSRRSAEEETAIRMIFAPLL